MAISRRTALQLLESLWAHLHGQSLAEVEVEGAEDSKQDAGAKPNYIP